MDVVSGGISNDHGCLPRPRAILHYVDLDNVGGVERYFLNFLEATCELPDLSQGLFLLGRKPIRDIFRPQITALGSKGVSLYRKKYVGNVKIPRMPSALRRTWWSSVARRYRPGVGLIWNLLQHTDQLAAMKSAGLAAVYWERGAGWYSDFESEAVRATLRDVDAALANSRAGAEMLKFRGYGRPVIVCQNGVRADIFRHRARPKELPGHRPLRIGVAARLVSKKGVALALHAVRLARSKRLDVELHLAGEGPDGESLRRLADSLNVADRVRFHGVVADMIPFYENIDCLLHPVLREPCSNTLAEAQYCGCPVVATNVDGVPEVVAPTGGVLVTAELEEKEYTALGVGAEDQTPYVYDPVRRFIRKPLAPDPEALLAGVESIVSSPRRYADISRGAIEWTSRELDPNVKYAEALAALHTIDCGPAPPPAGSGS